MRERTRGEKPTFTQGVEADLGANVIDKPFSTPCQEAK